MTRPGRPRGEVSAALVSLAAREEVWSSKAAATLQLSRRDASVAVYTLALRGHLQEVDRRIVEGSRRAVPVYRAACEATVPAILMLEWPPRGCA